MEGSKEYFAANYWAVSRLPLQYRDALEELFFFNSGQWRLEAAMLHSIERYGLPQIIQHETYLGIEIKKIPNVQTLYVLNDESGRDRLSAVVVYTREVCSLHVLYVGLDPMDSYNHRDQSYLLIDIFKLLLYVARQIRGVKSVEFNKGNRRLKLTVVPLEDAPMSSVH